MSWPAFWNQKKWQSYALLPMAKLVCWEAKRRLNRFNQNPPKNSSKATIVVVGNIVVGGTGKTPFIIWLVNQLEQQGLKVGIISRGYGAESKDWPKLVTDSSHASEVGDEPLMLYKQTSCPLAVSPKRIEALQLLESNYDLDVIISDDGLQHFALPRDIEVVVIDAQRQFGNGYCMPSGPLREPLERIAQVDFTVWNGLDQDQEIPSLEYKQKSAAKMQLRPVKFRSVKNPETELTIDEFIDKYTGLKKTAVAGIGNPARFFNSLNGLDLNVDGHAFADHHAYQLTELDKFAKPLIMTEKDAVKCRQFAKDDWWYLQIEPVSGSKVVDEIIKRQHLKQSK